MSKKEAAPKVHLHHLPKQYRIAGGMARARGMTRRGYTRPMAEAHSEFEEWRKQGFKGAWWWQYFAKKEEG